MLTEEQRVRQRAACKRWRDANLEEQRLRERETRKRYRVTDPDSVRAKKRAWRNSDSGVNSYLQRNYGMTIADYEHMLSGQGGGCGICGKLPTGRRLVVDHCHATGRVRGLLCTACNKAIGALGDTTDGVERALLYLKGTRNEIS